MALEIRPISAADQLRLVADRSGSFLQTPSWADVKADWLHERLGWFDGEALVGSALVLLRQTPRIKRFLAYVPEGPVVDWSAYDAAEILQPLLDYLKRRHVFTVKMGPQIVSRRWQAATIKAAVADGSADGLLQVTPCYTDPAALILGERLRELGWLKTAASGAGFGDFQPRYVFQVPLEGRSLEAVLGDFNQLWRRNIKKAAKSGVEVVQGTYDDLADFHALYAETAA